MKEYIHYDGLGLAELVKKKEVHPRELVQAAIQRIEAKNPKLNAVIHKMYEKAEKMADKIEPTGTFAGVPILLKDIAQEIEGEPITAGSKAFQNYRAKQDSEYVKRVKKTGTIILGQTNVPEFALLGITEPKHYGPTRNPWNSNHSPGGSSGGSAAAVASGMVPIAGANDGGGSIRIPGSYCGLFGLKPTRGRTPVGPTIGREWQGASVDHILSRSVRDSAAMLDEIKGHVKWAAFHAQDYNGSYLQDAETPLTEQLRIAFTTQSPLGTEVDPECREAVLNTAKLLESMGHIVEEKEAPVDGHQIAKSYLNNYFGEVAATLENLQSILGRKASYSDVEPTTWLLGLLGKATSAKEMVLSIREWDRAAYIMEEFHETYDFYLTPSTATPPVKIGELEPKPAEKLAISIVGRLGLGGLLKKTGIVDKLAVENLSKVPFSQLANLTGQPAMTLPLFLSEKRLPIGVQFMAARGREDLLFRLAGQIEADGHFVDVKQNPTYLS
ncbi:MAG TPA: amidase family protein [Bacillus sp. (in: firmicutes)]|uniref:amidase family protein n=1 Tax=Bacillus litorisediminis TaxID=2922713 RepID=UPI001FAEFE84|nr:amidase family protein [Bacillus litorisediminis]HWO74546.1 amidase family protein [Bacillus sp. (in: firmicutes)]